MLLSVPSQEPVAQALFLFLKSTDSCFAELSSFAFRS